MSPLIRNSSVSLDVIQGRDLGNEQLLLRAPVSPPYNQPCLGPSCSCWLMPLGTAPAAGGKRTSSGAGRTQALSRPWKHRDAANRGQEPSFPALPSYKSPDLALEEGIKTSQTGLAPARCSSGELRPNKVFFETAVPAKSGAGPCCYGSSTPLEEASLCRAAFS